MASSRSAEIRCVDPAQVQFVWPLVRDRIAKVLADHPCDTTIDATEADLLKGLQLLWVARDGFEVVGAATTAIIKTPSRKLCAVMVGFGAGHNLVPRFFAMIERYARAERCSNLRLSGRKGWQRMLKDFRQPWIVLDKELR